MQLSSATFATQKVCKLLLQIARLLSKVKVSKLFAQLFAPIKSVHKESCEKSLQTFTFFATFCSHKKRCNSRLSPRWVPRVLYSLLLELVPSRSAYQRHVYKEHTTKKTHAVAHITASNLVQPVYGGSTKNFNSATAVWWIWLVAFRVRCQQLNVDHSRCRVIGTLAQATQTKACIIPPAWTFRSLHSTADYTTPPYYGTVTLYRNGEGG